MVILWEEATHRKRVGKAARMRMSWGHLEAVWIMALQEQKMNSEEEDSLICLRGLSA